MNEADDVILLTVKISQEQQEARLKAIATQINFLRDAAKGLAKDLQDGTISQKQYDESLGRISKQLGVLQGEEKKEKATLDELIQARVKANGSLTDQRQLLAKSTADYFALSKAERENEQIGGALLKRIQDLNKEHEEETKKLTEKKKSIKDYILGLNILGVNVGETVDAFKSGAQGAGTFAKGIISARGALIALTAVPIVLVLTALVAFLTKSQAGMDYLARKTAGLTAVLTALTKIVIGVGEKLFKAFENGKLGATLLDAVITNLTNRFKGFQVIAEGIINLDWRKIADGFVQVGTGVTNATDKAQQLYNEMGKVNQQAQALTLESQKIRDAEIKLNLERAKGRADIEKLKKTSEDVTKSAQVREAAARQAYQKENELLGKSIALQQRKIDNLKAQAKLGIEGAESAAAITEEEIKLEGLKEESYTKQTELQNSINSIRQEGIDKARAAEKKAFEESIAQYKIALLQAKKNGEDILGIQEAIIKKQAQADLVGVEGVQARLLILKQAEADILELRVNYAIETAARLSNIKESEIKTLLAQVKEGTLAELELNKALIREEAQREKDQANATIKNKEELNAKLKQIDAESKKQLLDADKAFLVKQVELQQQRAEQQQTISNILLARFKRDQQTRITDEQARADTALAISKVGSKKEHLAILQRLEADRKAALNVANLTKDQIEAINADFNRKSEDEKERFGKAQIEGILSIAGQSVNILSNLFDAQSQRFFDQLDQQQTFALKSAGANADLRERIQEQYDQKREKAEKEQAKEKQKMAEAQALINGAVAVTEASPNIILMALAAATTLAQLAVIRSQKLAEGGVAGYVSQYLSDGRGAYLSSGPGTTVSDSIPARLSVKESVINARSTSMFYDQLSAMNVAGGGKPFPGAVGGSSLPSLRASSMYMPSFAGGGVMVSSSQNVDYKLLSGLIETGIANALANQKPPVLVISDLDKAQADQTRINNRTTIKP